MLVGGRDARVALYALDKTAEGGGGTPGGGSLDTAMQQEWQTRISDFIYAVAFSPSEKFAAFGGVAKEVTILDADSGAPLLVYSTAGAVPTLNQLNPAHSASVTHTLVSHSTHCIHHHS